MDDILEGNRCDSRITNHLSAFLLMAVVFVTGLLVSADGRAQEDYDGRFLNRAKDYAEAMLEKGRDRWGETHSPLFASVMNRKKLDLLHLDVWENKTFSNTGVTAMVYREGKKPHGAGQAAVDRVPDSANVTDDNALYTLLYRLTEVTGNETYAKAADRSLGYFWRNCQDANTGLMAWGEHMAWQLPGDTWMSAQPNTRNHEPAPFPHFERCFKLGPEVSNAITRYARGIWRWQIADQEKARWNRHCYLDEYPNTARKGTEYPRLVGQFCRTFSLAYEHSEDRELREELLKAVRSVVENSLRRSEPNGALPYATKKPKRFSLNQVLVMLPKLHGAAKRVPDSLAKKIRKLNRNTVETILEKLPHHLDGEKKPDGYITHSHRFEDFRPYKPDDPRKNYTRLWGRFPQSTFALQMLYYHAVADRPRMRDLGLKGAQAYLETENPDYGKKGPDQGTFADAIMLLARAHQMTGEQRYLDRAVHYAEDGIEMFMDEHSPLPKRTPDDARLYVSSDGGDDLMLALLVLDQVLRGADPPWYGVR